MDGPRLAEAFPEAAVLGAALRAAGLRVAVAESCTGGLLGAALTASPGSSNYLRGGVIAYADDLKIALLDVAAAPLEAHGAVSAEVAVAMAEGVRHRLGADLGIAVTGVAGPSESERKPAGLIFVAVAGPGDAAPRVERLDRDHGRESNRAEAVRAALRLAAGAVG